MVNIHRLALLLGSNISDRYSYLKDAIALIEGKIGNVVKQSSIYESEPWGFEASLAFLNQIVVVETHLQPLEILSITQMIERSLGRKPKTGDGYQSRTIDIDLLLYDDVAMKNEELTLPHPLMHERMFTLLPLVEVTPGWIHPVLGKTAEQLLAQCTDAAKVWRFNNGGAHDEI